MSIPAQIVNMAASARWSFRDPVDGLADMALHSDQVAYPHERL
ncbi:hypothetical protein ACFU96_34710 [Streptomyces sp. NPDC057620]